MTFLKWPLRLELDGVPAGHYEATFSWAIADVAAIPNDPPRDVVLLDDLGNVVVDFGTGQGSPSVPCLAGRGGHSCTIGLDAASATVRDFTVRVGFPGPAPVNTPPVADDQTVATSANVPVEIILAGSDAEQCELTFSIATLPDRGELSGITDEPCQPGQGGSPNSDSARVTFQPPLEFAGTLFTFTVFDGELNSGPGTVTMNVGVAAGHHLMGTVELQGMPSPITGALVLVFHPDGTPVDSAVSDPVDGSFDMLLDQGVYDLVILKNGFLPIYYTGLDLTQDVALLAFLLGGDLNGNGVVDVNDLVVPAQNQGKDQSPAPLILP